MKPFLFIIAILAADAVAYFSFQWANNFRCRERRKREKRFRCLNRFGSEDPKYDACKDYGTKDPPKDIVVISVLLLEPVPRCPCCRQILEEVEDEPLPWFNWKLLAVLSAAAVVLFFFLLDFYQRKLVRENFLPIDSQIHTQIHP